MLLFLIGVIALMSIRYILRTYNMLVNLRINVDRQSSHVQVHLTKRYDLIPALVEIVKGYAQHEKGTFEEVTRLRSQWGAAKSSDEKIKAASQLDSILSRLLVIQERYPELKADKSFQNIMYNMQHVEGELVHERKVYNKRVSFYNVKLQEFPSLIVARILGFKEKPFYQLEK